MFPSGVLICLLLCSCRPGETSDCHEMYQERTEAGKGRHLQYTRYMRTSELNKYQPGHKGRVSLLWKLCQMSDSTMEIPVVMSAALINMKTIWCAQYGSFIQGLAAWASLVYRRVLTPVASVFSAPPGTNLQVTSIYMQLKLEKAFLYLLRTGCLFSK